LCQREESYELHERNERITNFHVQCILLKFVGILRVFVCELKNFLKFRIEEFAHNRLLEYAIGGKHICKRVMTRLTTKHATSLFSRAKFNLKLIDIF